MAAFVLVACSGSAASPGAPEPPAPPPPDGPCAQDAECILVTLGSCGCGAVLASASRGADMGQECFVDPCGSREAFCDTSARRCGARAHTETPPPPPLTDYTVTTTTTDFGAALHEHDTLIVRSDGEVTLRAPGGGERTLEVAPSELDALAVALADPAFGALASTELPGEGVLTSVSVESPRLTLALHFSHPTPPGAAGVLGALAHVEQLAETHAPEAATAPACATDAECTAAECGCARCVVRHVSEQAPRGCAPGRCVASPCATQAVCDPATHRCRLPLPGAPVPTAPLAAPDDLPLPTSS